jgi:hypothetical protein
MFTFSSDLLVAWIIPVPPRTQVTDLFFGR